MKLTDLGLTQEQVFEAVVNKISSDLLQKPVTLTDEDGAEYEDFETTPYCQELRKQIKNKIDSAIEAIIDKHILPNAEQYVTKIVLTPTNRWGEKEEPPLTFVEYLTKRAEKFMLEDVDYGGKPKGTDSYSWHKKGTRIAYMIDRYLCIHIESWAKDALKEANESIVDGLQKAVEMQLKEILSKLKINVERPR